MIEDFRRAVADVVEAAQSRPHEVLPLAGTLFQLAGHVPVEERAAALAAIAERLRTPERIALGAVADLAVLCGALVEVGTPAGPAGVEITRRAREVGAQALRFADAWESTGEDDPPHPRETGESHRARVTPVLGDADMYSLASWATMQPYGIAIRAVLGDAEVRAALRHDPRGLAELQALSSRMRRHVEEFGEVYELLLMAEADRMLVLDRASGRAFRVRFDGVGDNFQLHTLLADALIGPEGRGVPGQRPMPDWVASATDLRDDPRLSIVEGEWDLVGGDGMWVGNEATPGSVPVVDGERVLVLEPISLKHTWRTGRRHPHIPGWLRVEEELGRDEAAAWWGRVHPAGTVVHPLVQSQEETSPVVDVPPEDWSPADAAPAPGRPGPRDADDSWNAVGASGASGAHTAAAYEGDSGSHGHGGPAGADASGPSGAYSAPGYTDAAGVPGGHGAPGVPGAGDVPGGWTPAAGAPGTHGHGGVAGAPGAAGTSGTYGDSGHGGAVGAGAPGVSGYGDTAGAPSGHGASGHGGVPGAHGASGYGDTAGAPSGHGAPGHGSAPGASGFGDTAGVSGGHGAPGYADAVGAPGHGGAAGASGYADVTGAPGAHGVSGHGGPGHGGAAGTSGAYGDTAGAGAPGYADASGYGDVPGAGDGSGGRPVAEVGGGAPGHGGAAGATGAQGTWDAFGSGGASAPPGASLVPPPPADRWEVEAEPSIVPGPEADREPPGAGLLEPMPEGVSDSSGWGPSWKS
ncbi:hypothetical protein HUT17_01350 [Nocardiopsis flavescens]|nr:hypothetical protein HUT17_01350 [Nocardiopsis flavescens]